MFENLRKAFREAVDNFKEELNRDQIPETVDRLLRGMHAEVTDAQAYVRKLEGQIGRTVKSAEREGTEAATCRRREEMASKIGDEETAAVAREFAEKHERTQSVLQKKSVALKEELAVRKAEVQEMLAKMKEAREQRAALAASAGRTSARESLGEADDLFAELDRMAEKISGEESRAEAAEELDDHFATGDEDEPPSDPFAELGVDERLAELKRRMGKE